MVEYFHFNDIFIEFPKEWITQSAGAVEYTDWFSAER